MIPLVACLFAAVITVVGASRAGAEALALPDAAAAPDATVAELLAGSHRHPPRTCPATGADRLVRILCLGRVRIGVRSNYPQFGEHDGDAWRGYEIDLARAIAARFGVTAVLVSVTPADRIALLAEDRIDLAIATIGHNTQRDGQARFVRPHYYRSETVLVGPRDVKLNGWAGVAGRAVCVTIGNGSNAELSSHGARLMLFGNPGQLLRELRAGTCSLVAQDDSFFAASFSDPAFAAAYDSKLGFAPVPWGIALARDGTDQLARAVGLTLQIFHRDGVLLQMARANHIATGFLTEQQAVWRRRACDTATAGNDPACVLPPLDADPRPTRFAGRVSDTEAWLASHVGLTLSLPMFKTAPAWSLLRNGVVNSLILVAGAIAGYSPPVSLAAAIAALGLINGANAGQAISEAIVTLHAEQHAGGTFRPTLFIRGLSRAATQIEAFLINAAKGTPIASFVGTPELLSALTDISSFSSERVTTYSLLLIFYTVVVMLVVRLCATLRLFLQWQGART
ncbi:MAG TPA: transporter substrate-binding domain-containing protein [Rhodopila sp.]